MSLKDSINADIKAALKAREKEKAVTLRLIMAAIKQIEVDERKELSDDDVIAILSKMVKQRRESIEQYEKGGRPELAAKEQTELALIQTYLPAQLSEEEVDAMIAQAISDTGAESIKDMGKVMGILKPQLQGRAEMGPVSGKVKARLS